MATNPNPALVTNEMWYFWEQFKKIEPTVLLGGIYANKSGYHNTRARNQASWPGNYSIVLPPDKLGPSDKSAAIDLTFPDAQAGNYKTIMKYSQRLLKSGKDLKDDRGNYLREFYGNADGTQYVDGWDFYYVRPATSDSSHLWHIHLSFLRKFVTSRVAMDAILSILRGETYAAYKLRISTPTVPRPVTPPVAKSVLVQELGDPAIYLSDGAVYRHVVDMIQLREIQALMEKGGLFNKVITIQKGALTTGYYGKRG